ncbi:MAG TPA: hypothetical protein VLR89_01610 [Anaerolineaceae bacterium]|nr:hypothetical protein [Anaerolineaceae bacterium]
MTTSNLSPNTIGWTGIITGTAAILAMIFLALMVSVSDTFGKINDVFNSLIGIASAVLAWMLYTQFRSQPPALSQIGLALAAFGAVFTIIGSILVMSGSTGFVLAGWFTGIGNALIGLWLISFCYSLLGAAGQPQNLLVFGIVTGAFMTTGLVGIPGITAKIDSMQAMPWYLSIAFFAYLGTYILYPIWAIILGRHLLLK